MAPPLDNPDSLHAWVPLYRTNQRSISGIEIGKNGKDDLTWRLYHHGGCLTIMIWSICEFQCKSLIDFQFLRLNVIAHFITTDNYCCSWMISWRQLAIIGDGQAVWPTWNGWISTRCSCNFSWNAIQNKIPSSDFVDLTDLPHHWGSNYTDNFEICNDINRVGQFKMCCLSSKIDSLHRFMQVIVYILK